MIESRAALIYSGGGRRDNLAEAIKRYEHALAIARRAGLPVVTATVLKNLGVAYRRLGDRTRAEKALNDAIETADRVEVRQIRWGARLAAALLASDRDPVRAE